MNLTKRYQVTKTGDFDLVGAVIDQWDELGYRPILMSQVVRRGEIETTLVFEKEKSPEFQGVQQLVNTEYIDADTSIPCSPIESTL